MKQEVKIGQQDYTVLILVRDDSGNAKTGLAFGDIDLAYSRVEIDNDVTTTDVAPADLVTPLLTDPHLDWGFLEVSAGDHPGLYRLDIHDDVFAVDAWSAVVTLTGAGLEPSHIEFMMIPSEPYAGFTQAAITAANAFFTGGGAAADVDLECRSLTVTNDTGTAVTFTASGGNGHAFDLAGNGTGEGLNATGGLTGHGIAATGGGTSGDGIYAVAGNDGDGIQAIGATNGHGMNCDGAGTGDGINTTGGTNGDGLNAQGGATTGSGIQAVGNNNNNAGMKLVKHGTGVDLDADALGYLAGKATGAADMTTEVVDNSILSRMLSNGDTSIFNPATDGLQPIRDAIVDANPQNHSATANDEVGNTTLDNGGFAETATDNADYYDTGPGAAVGGYGLNSVLTFGIGTGRAPSAVTVNGRFTAAALRTVQVWAYDYILTAWVQLSSSATDFGHSAAADSTQQYALPTTMVQVSDGEVQIRFTSTSEEIGDVWKNDYVNVTSVAQEAAGLTADVIQQAVWARADSGHDEDTLGYNVSKMHLIHGKVAAFTSASQFTIDTGVATNDAYNGMTITLEDKTDDHYESRRIIDYIGATKEVFVDRAFSFNPEAGVDDIYIMNGHYGNMNVTEIESADPSDTINAAVDAALDTAIPGVPTADSINFQTHWMATALIHKLKIKEADPGAGDAGDAEMHDSGDVSLGTVGTAFTSDGTHTVRKNMTGPV